MCLKRRGSEVEEKTELPEDRVQWLALVLDVFNLWVQVQL
jgi:hypothetical protein